MPILKGTASYARFKIVPQEASTDFSKLLPDALRSKAFEPLEREDVDERADGFVELENTDAVEFQVGETFRGEWALFSWRVDEFRIPASVVRAELEKWQKQFEAEHERRPGRKEKADAKLEIRHTLKSRAPIVTRTFDVSWQLASGEVKIWATARKVVDEIQDALEQALPLRLVPIVPSTVAEALGIDEKKLAPTPALSLVNKKEA